MCSWRFVESIYTKKKLIETNLFWTNFFRWSFASVFLMFTRFLVSDLVCGRGWS